jgi:hypothetical protein
VRALLLLADIGGYTRFTKLHRMSLAHAHENTDRLLKNSVPLPEYLLLTRPVLERCDDAARERKEPIEQELEGLGTEEVFARLKRSRFQAARRS